MNQLQNVIPTPDVFADLADVGHVQVRSDPTRPVEGLKAILEQDER
jgi:hypothetical protein